MRNILLVVLAICLYAPPVLAATTVYLKEGGTIRAKSVWRSKGKVHVLVNRDTLTEFSTAEIDMKRTFVRKRQPVRKKPAIPDTPQAVATVPAEPDPDQKPAPKKSGWQLPSLPNLTERNPESLLTGNKGESIKKHKKEMKEGVSE